SDLSRLHPDAVLRCMTLSLERSRQHRFMLATLSPWSDAPTYPEFFEINNLKAQLQAKITTISKLKAHIKALKGSKDREEIKKDIYEINTQTIEMEHRVACLIKENEHLKQTYKNLFDSFKKKRVPTKDQSASLIKQVNKMSVENEDLKAQIQVKVFIITSLKNELRKLRGKDVIKNDASKSKANTIAPGMYKLDLEPLAPSLRKNRESHINYIKHIHNQAEILWDIVEQAKELRPLNNYLDYALPTPEPETKVYRRKPKATKSIGSSSKSKTVGSKITNKSEPNQSWGSTVSDVPSYILIECRLSKLSSGIWTQTLRAYYEDVGCHIKHRLPPLHNRTAVATACYTQNRSLIYKCLNKTPYELLHDRKPDLSFLHVFGSLCYPTNDSEDLGKLKPKADIGIFVGYAPSKKAYRIYNKWTWLIFETIHVDFDELTTMAFEQFSLGPGPQLMTLETISLGLVP
ncbi:retrovirus-related pol polyprotein from transposon TNT 1-94, partial [Tanacetum coccineum]